MMTAEQSKTDKDNETLSQETMQREANICIASGLGLGVLSATTAAVIGTICPLCYIVAPALVVTGIVRKRKAKTRKG